MKTPITILVLCASFGLNVAPAAASMPQRAAARKSPSGVGRSECALAVGLCVTVPASWQRLGDVFNDLGFVVAEPHSGVDAAGWPQLTVAAIDVPPRGTHGTSAARPSLDALVDIVLTPDGSFTSAETLQRTHLILNGGDAEIIRVRLHDDSDRPEAIEEIALIEGEDGLVYSIALRCSPQEFARLEPVFQKAAHSWRIQQTAVESKGSSTPGQDSEKQ